MIVKKMLVLQFEFFIFTLALLFVYHFSCYKRYDFYILIIVIIKMYVPLLQKCYLDGLVKPILSSTYEIGKCLKSVVEFEYLLF